MPEAVRDFGHQNDGICLRTDRQRGADALVRETPGPAHSRLGVCCGGATLPYKPVHLFCMGVSAPPNLTLESAVNLRYAS